MTTTKPQWQEAEATVSACEYDFAAGRALAFGIPSSKHFRITFTYYAHGKPYTGTFSSPTYLKQGETFPISYNPFAPQQNTKSVANPMTKTPLFAIGIAGSIILSLIWLAMMHSCN